jgi:hypothetical protein
MGTVLATLAKAFYLRRARRSDSSPSSSSAPEAREDEGGAFSFFLLPPPSSPTAPVTSVFRPRFFSAFRSDTRRDYATTSAHTN